MTQQPEALRLARELDDIHTTHVARNAAAELRRLHALCAEWEIKATAWLASPEAAKRLEGYRSLAERATNAETQRDVLLEALKDATKTIEHLGYPLAAIERARAAIKAVEETK